MAIRVYIAMSLDGFIAGPGDDLSFLPEAADEAPGPEVVSWPGFMSNVGAILMGRRTFDVVQGFDLPEWPYAEWPVLVATHRPLGADLPPGVEAVTGTIDEVLDAAVARAGERDVYVDGGVMVRAALEAARVDDLIVTVAPSVLGDGVPLFAGLAMPVGLRIERHVDHPGGMLQLHLVPKTTQAPGEPVDA